MFPSLRKPRTQKLRKANRRRKEKKIYKLVYNSWILDVKMENWRKGERKEDKAN